MREIKFRGKSDLTIEELEDLEIPHKNGWVIGNLIGDEKRPVIVGPIVDLRDEYFNTEWWVSVIPESVGQYTGLKDKNGVEIYEGDIVSGVSIDTQGSFSYTGKIVWYENNVCLGYYIEDSTGGAWELKQAQTRISLDHITGTIIGNIYDNPELLEVAK